MKLGRAPATVMILSMMLVSGFEFLFPSSTSPTRNPKLVTRNGPLQSDYPGPAAAPHVAVQGVARVNYQGRQVYDALIVDLAVVGDDDQTISRPNLLISKGHGRERLATAFGVGVVKTELMNERIVIADCAPLAAQSVDNRKRRTLAHVVDVSFISHAQNQNPGAVHRFAIIVQTV